MGNLCLYTVVELLIAGSSDFNGFCVNQREILVQVAQFQKGDVQYVITTCSLVALNQFSGENFHITSAHLICFFFLSIFMLTQSHGYFGVLTLLLIWADGRHCLIDRQDFTLENDEIMSFMYPNNFPICLNSQALVDAPDMVRSQMNFKRLSLTDIKIDIKRIPKKKTLIAAMEAAGK